MGTKWMGRKGVAVRYIIALILGIAAVGLLGYWFFVLGGKLGGEAVTTECRAKQVSYCQAWKALNYGDVKPIEPDWGTCTPVSTSDASECQTLLGETTTTTTTTIRIT